MQIHLASRHWWNCFLLPYKRSQLVCAAECGDEVRIETLTIVVSAQNHPEPRKNYTSNRLFRKFTSFCWGPQNDLASQELQLIHTIAAHLSLYVVSCSLFQSFAVMNDTFGCCSQARKASCPVSNHGCRVRLARHSFRSAKPLTSFIIHTQPQQLAFGHCAVEHVCSQGVFLQIERWTI